MPTAPYPTAPSVPMTLGGLRAAMISLFLSMIGIIGFGGFNEKLFGQSVGSYQQALILGLWCLCVLICLGRQSGLRHDRVASTIYALIVLLGVASSVWSPQPLDSASKALVLAGTSFSAFMVVTTIGLQPALTAVRRGLTITVLVSIFVVFLRPDIGLMDSYLHSGKWRGIFDQKQLLGAASSLLFVLYLYGPSKELADRSWRLCMLAITFIAIIFTESAVALVTVSAVATINALYKIYTVRSIALAAPVFITIVAGIMVLYLGISGNRSFSILGEDITAQNRTVIWEFALRSWSDVALFGYGVNGFWTDQSSLAEFQLENGWALDNYHSGYVSTLAETGLVGFMLLLALLLVKRSHLSRAISIYGWKKIDPIMVGFPLFFFTLNITETFLFRSTSTYFSLAIMIFVTYPFAPKVLNGETVSPLRNIRRAAEARTL